jgi:hypothetical protein
VHKVGVDVGTEILLLALLAIIRLSLRTLRAIGGTYTSDCNFVIIWLIKTSRSIEGTLNTVVGVTFAGGEDDGLGGSGVVVHDAFAAGLNLLFVLRLANAALGVVLFNLLNPLGERRAITVRQAQ